MKKLFVSLALVSFALTLGACGQNTNNNESTPADQTSTAESVSSAADTRQKIDGQLYTDDGLKVYFDKKGARISKIECSGKQIAKDGFTVGRCANRIANGTFTLNGETYNVAKNNGDHSLHGGSTNRSQWEGSIANANWTLVEQTAEYIEYTYHSADGENGYPGNMDLTVRYTLSQTGELSIQYSAKSDKDTLCNPTNHLFMALNGNTSYSNINLMIDADNYTPLENQIPTGAITPVEGTQFDYRTEKAFDSTKSYDDNYVLKANPNNECRKVASMSGSVAKVDVYTDRAGLQLYKDGSGNICLETQQLPDWINQPTFADYGTTILRANAQFSSKTIYHFSKVA